ncbi:MAG: PAS domain-containing protein, partial [Lentisphaeria bacterium]
FAKALIEGKAESAMCVSYLRKLAQKKANALIKYIPAGVVVVGSSMKIIEANLRFASMFGEEALMIFEQLGSFDGASIKSIVPFAELFEAALVSKSDLVRNGYCYEDKLLDIKIFTIEPGVMVGAVIEDVTEIECRREKIAEKAREVIKKNVITVQQIAKCLGEHMADTELLLRQVANGFDEGKQ